MRANCVELMDHANPNASLGTVLVDSIQNMVKALSKLEKKATRFLNNDDDDDDHTPQELPECVQTATFVEIYPNEYEHCEDDGLTRAQRYQKAYQAAYDSDNQGYFSSNDSGDSNTILSPQELAAASWAVFSTELLPEMDAPYRLQALDTSDAIERLKLGLYLLNEKKDVLKQLLRQMPKYEEEEENDNDNDNEEEEEEEEEESNKKESDLEGGSFQ